MRNSCVCSRASFGNIYLFKWKIRLYFFFYFSGKMYAVWWVCGVVRCRLEHQPELPTILVHSFFILFSYSSLLFVPLCSAYDLCAYYVVMYSLFEFWMPFISTYTELMYAGNASHEPFFISFKTSIHSTALAMQSCIDACSLSLSLRTNRTMWPLTYPSRHCMCHHQLVHLLARMRQCVVDRNARIFKHFSTFLFSFHSSSSSTTAIRTSCSRRQIRLVRTDISSFARPAISYWAHVHTPDRMFSRRCRNYDRH